ncbi:hypothetical protein ACE1TF_03485 [Geomicrobium sp. JSM 1781026]|uniref:hypothetical protein n=1 Tax=Geomicrobium sp. JSM 1781026 TaxID=3344580 RepID=UPI0035C0B341
MKFFECEFPFYAMIKARTLKQAKSLYKKEVWLHGGSNWRELPKDVVLLKYGMLHREHNEPQFLLMDIEGDDAKVLIIK